MTQYSHVCVKPGCGKSYEDNDPDAYYCPNCNEEGKAIAKQIDAQLANRPKKVQKSDYQVALEKGKTVKSGNPYGGQSTFVKAGDLGITLA